MAQTTATPVMTTKDTSKRLRSPSYPGIGLADAVEKAKLFYTKEAQGKHPVPLSSLCRAWGYSSEKNGAFLVAVSALKQYGLIEEAEGTASRQLKLTSAGKSVAIYPDGAPERMKELKTAALRPRINQTLWSWYGSELPSDETVGSRLQMELEYNQEATKGIIGRYRSAIQLAKLSPDDKTLPEGANASDTSNGIGEGDVAMGDLVQWCNGGALQFSEPRVVTGISDDRQFVFVEGSLTGIPMAEITVQKRAGAAAEPQSPQPNVTQDSQQQQNRAIPLTPPPVGVKRETFELEEGTVVFQYPARISEDAFADLQDWVELLLRKIGRPYRKTPQ